AGCGLDGTGPRLVESPKIIGYFFCASIPFQRRFLQSVSKLYKPGAFRFEREITQSYENAFDITIFLIQACFSEFTSSALVIRPHGDLALLPKSSGRFQRCRSCPGLFADPPRIRLATRQRFYGLLRFLKLRRAIRHPSHCLRKYSANMPDT